MSLHQQGCCFDLASVLSFKKEGMEYNEQLPGYLRDLCATHGSLVGVAFANWLPPYFSGGAEALQDCLQYLLHVNLKVLVLEEKDPLPALWGSLRRWGISWETCALYLGRPLDAFESQLVREAGFKNFRQLGIAIVR
jgi:hypothetical protein